jgi:prepilin peptidase CpaA
MIGGNMSWPEQLATSILVALVLAVAFFDIRERRIPNFLVFPAMLIGIVLDLLWFFQRDWGHLDGPLGGLKGIAMGFLLLLIPYAVGGMKAGDVKFLMAIGAFVGWRGAVSVLLAAVLFYPIMALIFVVRERKARLTWLRFRRVFWNFLGFFIPGLNLYALRLESLDDPLVASVRTPFGVSLTAGTLIFLFFGSLVGHL